MDKAGRMRGAQDRNNVCIVGTASHIAMSQNTHTLYLFFEDSIKLKLGQLVYQYLAAGSTEQAQRWADKLGGPDLQALWDAGWFNPSVAAEPSLLRLQFDTSTHGDLPLLALETLFRHGLQAAVLEVFHGQVGETERMHFDAGQWVSRQAFFALHPQWCAVVEPAGEGAGDGESACSKDPARPLPVARLRQQEAARKREAQEAAEAFVEMARAMGKSGKSPVQGLIAVLLLRAGFKGLVQAAVFTVVTVLLFKGLWLWLGLGVVLAVVLPLYYIVAEYKELQGDDDGSADGGTATAMAQR